MFIHAQFELIDIFLEKCGLKHIVGNVILRVLTQICIDIVRVAFINKPDLLAKKVIDVKKCSKNSLLVHLFSLSCYVCTNLA